MHPNVVRFAMVLTLTLLASTPTGAYAIASAPTLTSGTALTTQDDYDTNGNPYPTYNDYEGGQIACTWYVWEQAYNRLGIKLPGVLHVWNWGNAKSWYSQAEADPNYSVGHDPRPNSIAVYGDGGNPEDPGHVEFVTNVGNSTITVNTGGYLGDANWPNPPGVREGWVKSFDSLYNLIGYIYLEQESPMTVTTANKSISENTLATKAVSCYPITVKDAKGAVTYEKISGLKNISIDKNTGKVTISKGSGHLTYTARVSITDAGGNGYKPKTVSVNVNVRVVAHPKAPAITSITSLEGGFEVRWDGTSSANGYELKYADNDAFKNVKTVAYEDVIVKGRKTITGLSGNKRYWLTIRSYTKSDGVKFYSTWSSMPKSVTTKPMGNYKVTFKPNGGKGTATVQTIRRGKSVALKPNKFTRSGYKFAGWNTKANGKGKAYTNRERVKNLAASGKTVILYAQWQAADKTPVWVLTKSNGQVFAGDWYNFSFDYYANGLLKRAVDYEGFARSFTYSKTGRLEKSTGAYSGDGVYASCTYEHDKHGRVVKATGTRDGNKWIRSFSYDGNGRIKKSVETVSGSFSETRQYAYDTQGRVRVEKQNYKESSSSRSQTTIYSYDKRGGLVTAKYSNGGKTEFKNTYSSGRLVKQNSSGTGLAYKGSVEYKYKKVMVPKSLVRLVKAQQRTLIPRRWLELQLTFDTLPLESAHA